MLGEVWIGYWEKLHWKDYQTLEQAAQSPPLEVFKTHEDVVCLVVDLVVLGWHLDLMISTVFSNLKRFCELPKFQGNFI